LPHPLQVVTDLEERGIGFRSVTEAIDTTTAGAKLIFSIFGAIAEFERNRIRETDLGRPRRGPGSGRVGERPPKVTPEQAQIGETHARQRNNSAQDRRRPRRWEDDAAPAPQVNWTSRSGTGQAVVDSTADTTANRSSARGGVSYGTNL
jgi:hypothetical protein